MVRLLGVATNRILPRVRAVPRRGRDRRPAEVSEGVHNIPKRSEAHRLQRLLRHDAAFVKRRHRPPPTGDALPVGHNLRHDAVLSHEKSPRRHVALFQAADNEEPTPFAGIGGDEANERESPLLVGKVVIAGKRKVSKGGGRAERRQVVLVVSNIPLEGEELLIKDENVRPQPLKCLHVARRVDVHIARGEEDAVWGEGGEQRRAVVSEVEIPALVLLRKVHVRVAGDKCGGESQHAASVHALIRLPSGQRQEANGAALDSSDYSPRNDDADDQRLQPEALLYAVKQRRLDR